MKKKYRVYISQINQQYFEVEAYSVEAAEKKAERLWEQCNGPTVVCVEGYAKAE